MATAPPLPFYLAEVATGRWGPYWRVYWRNGNSEPATAVSAALWLALPEETRRACMFKWNDDAPGDGLPELRGTEGVA